jgi:hypothetical protein
MPSVTVVRDRQNWNAKLQIPQPPGITTCLRPLLAKALQPTRVQLLGIITFASEVHSPKQWSLIVAHPSGMITLASELQP